MFSTLESIADMSEPNLIGSFVSVRGEFRRMEVVEVLSSGCVCMVVFLDV